MDQIVCFYIARCNEWQRESGGGEYSHWYYEEGRVKSVNGKSVVVAFDKNEEKETFFKDEDTIELDCKSCDENTVNLQEEGMRFHFLSLSIVWMFSLLKLNRFKSVER